MNKPIPIEDLSLKRDVFAISGNCIAQEGSRLGTNFLEDIATSGRIFSDTCRLFSETPIYRDLVLIINEGMYSNIFAPFTLKGELLKTLGRASFHPIFYEELDWMKVFDFYTYHHILITAALTTRLAMDFFEDKEKVASISYSTLIHDFGKSRIPLQILQKGDALTKHERSYIHEHPVIGFVLLTYYMGNYKSLACKVALEHHEKMDGSGYPMGVEEDDQMVKLITVCDIFDALISHRPYRETPFDQRGALDHLLEEAEAGKLDKDVVYRLISYSREEKPSPDKLVISRKKRGSIPKKNYYGIIKEEEKRG